VKQNYGGSGLPSRCTAGPNTQGAPPATSVGRLIGLHLEALAELGWAPPATEDVIDQILRGELLPLVLAADVFECSDEKLRKLWELMAGEKRPLGVNVAGRWLVSVPRLFDDLEQGTLDRRRRGRHERLRAEQRAAKYEGWARPQEPVQEG
jgi:hypothetical protein